MIFFAFLCNPALAGEIVNAPPSTPDSSAYYLFYMHGAWLEEHSESEPNRAYGIYRYRDILDALSQRGFVVISEKRAGRIRPKKYAQNVARQVNALLDAGVPPSNITVSGFSKGGAMTLLVGGAVNNSKINFVVLAGCGIGRVARSYQRFLQRDATRMRGRFLSLYDSEDKQAGTCSEAFSAAGLKNAKEIVLALGSGHGAFYRPLHEWLAPVTAWAKRH